MTDNRAPDIKPIKLKEYETKQSKYEQVGKLPMRAMLCAPSGGGKTISLQNMGYIYIHIFIYIADASVESICIFSPSVDIFIYTIHGKQSNIHC